MRMLIWHVDAFAAEPTERGRSKYSLARVAALGTVAKTEIGEFQPMRIW